MKRVFNIDIETCEHCGGTGKIIARPGRYQDHLDHLEKEYSPTPANARLATKVRTSA